MTELEGNWNCIVTYKQTTTKMELAYFILIITSFLYGVSGVIDDWKEFVTKLINVLVILTIFILVCITGDDGPISDRSDWYWMNYLLPVPAVYIGAVISDRINDDDWRGIAAILAIIGIIASIVITCIEI